MTLTFGLEGQEYIMFDMFENMDVHVKMNSLQPINCEKSCSKYICTLKVYVILLIKLAELPNNQ